MKKNLGIFLAVILIGLVGFSLYKAFSSHKANQGNGNIAQNTAINSVQESNISDVISDISAGDRSKAEILFLFPVSNTEIKIYTVGIDGKNLKELLTLNKNEFKTTGVYGNNFDSLALKKEVFTNGTTVSYIKNNIDKFKYILLNFPLFAFSNNFCAYSAPIGKNDLVSGGTCFKGVYLYDMATGKTVRIDKNLTGKLPNSSFSKDGSLFVTSLSFSQNGKFLFVSSYPDDRISIFSLEQMKFIETFQTNMQHIWNIDEASNSLYFLAGTDTFNVYRFDTDTKNVTSLTNCQESSFAISPDGQNLVFIETYADKSNDLCILNTTNGNIKKINYPKGEYKVAGFVSDSKHLIIKQCYKISETDTYYHTDIYLLNLDTLKQAKVYSESEQVNN